MALPASIGVGGGKMINLTQDERKVVLFLAVVALVGVGVNFLVKQFSPEKGIVSFSADLGRVNLNSADKKTLMGISGIGEKLAQRILDYRDKREGFNNADELMGIKGINQSKFAKIKEYLLVK